MLLKHTQSFLTGFHTCPSSLLHANRGAERGGGGKPPRGPAVRARPARACAVLTDGLRDPASRTRTRRRGLCLHTQESPPPAAEFQRRPPRFTPHWEHSFSSRSPDTAHAIAGTSGDTLSV